MSLRGDLSIPHQILGVSLTTDYYFNYTMCYSSFWLNEMKVNEDNFLRKYSTETEFRKPIYRLISTIES